MGGVCEAKGRTRGRRGQVVNGGLYAYELEITTNAVRVRTKSFSRKEADVQQCGRPPAKCLPPSSLPSESHSEPDLRMSCRLDLA